jgi:hypothetical protein
MTTSDQIDPAPAAQQLLNEFGGMWTARAVQVVAELGVADAIDRERPRSVENIAEATETHAPSLYRLLRALASAGIFVEEEPGLFGHSPMSRCLRVDEPGTLYHFARWSYDWQWQSLSEIAYTLRTGWPAFDRVYGHDYWTYLHTVNPAAGALFNEGMASLSALADHAVVAALDLTRVGTLVDVGGGRGGLLTQMLHRFSTLKGVLLDLPAAIADATVSIEKSGVADRCELVSGNFFEAVPPSADGYLLQRILHDWDDDAAVQILRACRVAMRADSRLFIVEGVLRPGAEDPGPVFLDVDMMLSTGGRERTGEDFRFLLAKVGLRIETVRPTTSSLSIIEAVSGEDDHGWV